VPPVLGPGFSASTTQQELDYSEQTLTATWNQLMGNHWTLGAGYRISRAQLDNSYPDVPASAITAGGFQPQQSLAAILQQANAFILYNHPCGFFARAGALWTMQINQGYAPDIPGDTFWQINLEVGYRFARRHAEVRVGLLNLTDQDYQLNPLNLTPELPRERTLAVSFRFNF